MRLEIEELAMKPIFFSFYVNNACLSIPYIVHVPHCKHQVVIIVYLGLIVMYVFPRNQTTAWKLIAKETNNNVSNNFGFNI